jgi:hypothetical protein
MWSLLLSQNENLVQLLDPKDLMEMWWIQDLPCWNYCEAALNPGQAKIA